MTDAERLESRLTSVVEDELYMNADEHVVYGAVTHRYEVTDEITSGPEAVLRRTSDGAKFIVTLNLSVREYDR